MKRYIIIGISFFTFALISGCSKSEEDKCKNKGWYWNESTKACQETAPEGEIGTGVAEAETQESCKSKTGYVWDTNSSQCKRVDYFMVFYPDDNSVTVNVYLVKDISVVKDNPEDTNTEALLTMMTRSQNRCVRVHESYLSKLVVRVLKAHTFSVSDETVCGGPDAVKSTCELGVYEVVSDNDDNFSLIKTNLSEEKEAGCITLEPSS